jgi:hypothetical protein
MQFVLMLLADAMAGIPNPAHRKTMASKPIRTRTNASGANTKAIPSIRRMQLTTTKESLWGLKTRLRTIMHMTTPRGRAGTMLS